ncbi:MAG: GspE/PulE family protein [Planctomycetota bacterium]|jgi:type IV pilus assembly protein PilB
MSPLFGFNQKQDVAVTEENGNFTEDEQIKGLSNLYTPEEDINSSSVRDVAKVLLEMEKISQEQLTQIRQMHSQNAGKDIVEILKESGFVEANDIAKAQADLYGHDWQTFEPESVNPEAFNMLEFDYIKNNNMVPVSIDGENLVVATSQPGDVFIIEDVKRLTQMNLQIFVCPQDDIDKVCAHFAGEQKDSKVEYDIDNIISDMTDVEIVQEKEQESEDLEKMAGQSPIIKFVNYLISNAIKDGASDIHIEPKKNTSKIRYRIDGVLFELMEAPIKNHPAVVSRIKIMSNLDISERRLPQDGKITVIVGGRNVDLRVSTLPTNQGEKVVIRVLDSQSIVRGLEHLGMESDVEAEFREQIVLPHGILLVTGPTGSGKSTTLYSSLCQMDGEKLNISTVEDPVEYELDFCNQVQVIEKIGLDFASSLRSLLRQDPDIIMIGEIRDSETARIAVQAALTGHLVLSTLHTNDAASSITRLVNIGIDAYLIAASLNGILAQRLVRRICPDCKKPYEITDNMRPFIEEHGLSENELFKGTGCDNCRKSGYAGRIGIYELLVIDDIYRDMINKDSSVSNMRQVFRDSGSSSLFDDGIKKIKQGMTTIEEVLRVTQACKHATETPLEEELPS